MTTAASAAEAVSNGAAILDEHMPGWHEKIDLDRLDISDASCCIYGQLGEQALDLLLGSTGDDTSRCSTGAAHGVTRWNWTWTQLNQEWTELIEEKRKTREQRETREVVLA